MLQGHLSDPRIKEITQKVLQATKETLGDKLDKIILFGSYARGDFDSESDMDFFILANVPQEEANKWRRDIHTRMPGIDLEYDMLVSLHITNSFLFYNHVDVLPYYRNVLQEGVALDG